MKVVWSIIWLVVFAMLASSCNAAPDLKFKVLGVQGEILESVVTRLQLKKETITIYDDNSVKDFYQEAPQEIVKVLELYGYFKASVVPSVSVQKKDRWESVFRVSLGSPVRIIAIDLALLGPGATDKKILKHLDDFPLHQGEVFQTAQYNDAKQFLFDLADAYGYINAFLATKEVRIDLANNTAKVTLHFDTGLRYYFGETTFVTPFFSRDFLKRFLPYSRGKPYSNKEIYKLQEALSNSVFFQKVSVTPQIIENKERIVPVEVVLIPRKARQYNVGMGFGTDTGIRGSLGVELRHLTPSGHSFKGGIQGSQVQNTLELHYLIPGKYPPTDLYDVSVAGKTLSLDKGKSLTGQVGVGYVTILKKWYQTLRLNLQHEHYQLTGQPYESSTLLIPSVNWLHSKSDDPVRPNKGHSINVNIQGASRCLAASDNFLQTQIDAKYLRTFFTRMQIILHATFGYTAINDINSLPLSLQFYTGGTQSIRGYGYNTIGPGYNLVVGSVELRHRLIDDWYLAAFFDTGNANNNLFSKLSQGVGGGIVWRTSIGTLELTYAKAITQPGTPGRVQFSLGAEL